MKWLNAKGWYFVVGRCQMSWGAFCRTFEGYSLFSPHGWKIDEEHAFLSCLKRLLSPKNRSVNYSKEWERVREVKKGWAEGRAEQPPHRCLYKALQQPTSLHVAPSGSWVRQLGDCPWSGPCGHVTTPDLHSEWFLPVTGQQSHRWSMKYPKVQCYKAGGQGGGNRLWGG